MVENSQNKNLIPIAIVVAGIVIAGAIIYVGQQKGKESQAILPPQQIGEKVINYINENILQGQATASLKEIVEENGLYKMIIKIGDLEFPSHVSRDGKLLFTEAINLEERIFLQETPEQETPETEKDEKSLENFAKCLAEKGAKFYGSFRCGWCKRQKELFGQAEIFLPYVECIDEKTQEMTLECQSAGITAFPTWEFPEKGKIPGYKSLEQLAELSGCQL